MKNETTPKKSSPATVADDPAPAGSQREFERFLPLAQKVAASELRPMRADVNLAVDNAKLGASAVLAQKDRVAKALPEISAQSIEDLPNLGQAVVFAAGQVERFVPPPSDVKKLLSRAHEVRGILLAWADALAKSGVLPVKQVAKIHEGHGGIDTAGDCVALAALFQKNPEARKKTPVTTAQVTEAAEVGSRLLGILKPKAAKRKRPGDGLAQAVTARDQLWTLFEKSWEDNVWRAGAWLFRRAVDAHVPPLQSRVVGKRKNKAKKTKPSDAAPRSAP